MIYAITNSKAPITYTTPILINLLFQPPQLLVGFCDLKQYLPWVGYWLESQLQMTPFWVAANVSVVKQWWDLTLWENMNLHTPCNVASRLTRDPGMSSRGLDLSAANPLDKMCHIIIDCNLARKLWSVFEGCVLFRVPYLHRQFRHY